MRYNIDDTKWVRPHVRLCHLILSEALTRGYTAVKFQVSSGGLPSARAKTTGSWRPFMTFPVPVYKALVAYLKHMAGPDGTILVRLADRDASVRLAVRPNSHGSDDIVLRVPDRVA
jgi:hypothetical protein